MVLTFGLTNPVQVVLRRLKVKPSSVIQKDISTAAKRGEATRPKASCRFSSASTWRLSFADRVHSVSKAAGLPTSEFAPPLVVFCEVLRFQEFPL